MPDLFDNPMGTDGFEFVEYTAPMSARCMRCSSGWAFALSGGTAQERHALPAGRRQLHRERGAGEPRRAFRRGAWTIGLRDGVPGAGRGQSLQARDRTGREAVPLGRGANGVEHSRDRGDRRQRHLSRRPVWAEVDLRCRFRGDRRGARLLACGRGSEGHRSRDAQRLSRQHGQMGGLLRDALQFSRNPLFRYRGQAHGPQEPRDDEPVRKNPHPDQRKLRRQVADRGISQRLSRRGIQHIALSTGDIYATVEGCARTPSRSRTRLRPTTRASIRAYRGTARIWSG